jgi:hypothetical protein
MTLSTQKSMGQVAPLIGQQSASAGIGRAPDIMPAGGGCAKASCGAINMISASTDHFNSDWRAATVLCHHRYTIALADAPKSDSQEPSVVRYQNLPAVFPQ